MAKSPFEKFSRRSFLKGSGAAAAATTLATGSGAVTAEDQESAVISGWTTISLEVNGKAEQVKVEPRTTLLDVLRYDLDLTGAKPVTLDGSSGASTVLVDGKPVMASTTLALAVKGKKVQTVESLDGGDDLDAVPAAFVDEDAQQCGFCTPGFVIAVRAFLNKHPDATEQQIRDGLNGNICRCGTYADIIRAALSIVKGGGNG